MRSCRNQRAWPSPAASRAAGVADWLVPPDIFPSSSRQWMFCTHVDGPERITGRERARQGAGAKRRRGMAGGSAASESPTKRRTRKAIVDATAALLARGITPSMGEVADAAEVSRRTVYLYFSTLEQLLVDASL